MKLAMLGSGFIADFYTGALHGQRNRDRVHVVQSRSEDNLKSFCQRWNVPKWTTSMQEAIEDPEVEAVVIALPNHLHLEATLLAAKAGKPVLCTKPLGRNADEARQMLEAVEEAGIFHGYLEDLVYTPKTLKAVEAVQKGALGRILWARSRETHPGPHSDWFWTKSISGGGAILDLACHCIEIGRHYIGKDIKPVEVMCWADTLVKPIDAEDHAIGLVRYETGAVAQFEVSWAFRGGMDLRDEVCGTEGTIWNNHFLRTGFEMFTSGGKDGYVAEKAESNAGWLFPVGDEVNDLGYNHMFTDILTALENGTAPLETFYDGYVVNAIMDAALKSAQTKTWEPVDLAVWRGQELGGVQQHFTDYDADHYLVKEEVMPGGQTKIILKEKATGRMVQRVVNPQD
ncbi:Predicted dehydrogenase [Catalinimonas alkaloidigena]|uniref:Predicted dehydrogenase n=1 Tax=Catalinimonas alkaloidigena TaxID=1075417 RepID=A0A1G9K5N9_9BACT|nr:Gfo/Idh/MocA family oxidoreductase [Catalinimonas alkaloidigena]SDL45068.1 Predicted dehydrogenase [Catalinimonas alkaloidigena]